MHLRGIIIFKMSNSFRKIYIQILHHLCPCKILWKMIWEDDVRRQYAWARGRGCFSLDHEVIWQHCSGQPATRSPNPAAAHGPGGLHDHHSCLMGLPLAVPNPHQIDPTIDHRPHLIIAVVLPLPYLAILFSIISKLNSQLCYNRCLISAITSLFMRA